MDPSPSKPLDIPLESLELSQPTSPPSWGSLRLPPSPAMTVNKDLLRVRLRLLSGPVLEGDLYLTHDAHQDPVHEVLQLLRELKDGFFPLHDVNGEMPLVHTWAVQWIAVPQPEPPEAYGEKRQVRLVLWDGQTLSGVVELDVETNGPRVSDLLNEKRPYLLLWNEGLRYVVNRRALMCVHDLGLA